MKTNVNLTASTLPRIHILRFTFSSHSQCTFKGTRARVPVKRLQMKRLINDADLNLIRFHCFANVNSLGRKCKLNRGWYLINSLLNLHIPPFSLIQLCKGLFRSQQRAHPVPVVVNFLCTNMFPKKPKFRETFHKISASQNTLESAANYWHWEWELSTYICRI